MRFFILIFNLFGLVLVTTGQTVDLRFVDFKPNSRLSSTYVNDIDQDDLGFIWIASENGLQRFDGDEYRYYLTDKYNSFDITESSVNEIFADKQGFLWIATNSYLCRYNYHNDSIQIIAEELSTNGLKSAYVEHFIAGADSSLYIAQGSSLYQYLYAKNSFKELFSVPRGEISSIAFVSDSVLLLSTVRDGLIYQFNVFTGEYTDFELREEYTQGNNVADIAYYDNRIWVATNDAGVFSVNPATNQYRGYEAENIYAQNIKNFYVDRDSFLWMIDFTGLKLYVKDRDFFQGYHANESDEYAIPRDVARIFHDRDGNYWTAHYPGGIGFSPRPMGFTRFDSKINSPFCLTDNNVSAVTEDVQGNLYMGNPHNGIDVFMWSEGRTLTLRHSEENVNGLGRGAVFDLFTDSKNRIWVGTFWGGLQQYIPQNQIFITYKNQPDNPHSISSNDVRAIDEDKEGFLWLCTHGTGVSCFDPKNETFQSFSEANSELANDYTFDVLCATDQSVWVATSWGLSCLRKGETKFHNYRFEHDDSSTITSNFVYTVFEDRMNRIWVGTNNGLNLYQPETDDFKRIDVAFNDRNIVSIIDDDDSTLWIGTYNGLSRYYPQTGMVNNISKEDGLTSNDFLPRAVFNNGKNTLFFGTLHGITFFNPHELNIDHSNPTVRLTSFKLYGEERTNHNYHGLKRSIVVADRIEIDYSDKVFSLAYSALDYSAFGNNQYACYLEGFETDWNYVGNQRTVTYTNLNPGKYTFRVKTTDNQGFWSPDDTSVDIIVVPPFWLTWWFFLFVLICLVFTIIFVIKWREYSLVKQNILLENKIESRTREIYTQNKLLKLQKEKLEEANKMKNNFFRIIAHDLRSPVSSVVQLVSLLEEQASELQNENRKIVETIGFTANNLHQMLEEMLVWGRNQMGNLNLELSKTSLSEILEQSFENLTDVAFIKKIELQNLLLPHDYVMANTDGLKIAFRNLLSNAIKFSYPGGKVEVFSLHENNAIVVAVKDEGMGMEKSKAEKLFDNTINQSSRGTKGEKGTGLGLLIPKLSDS